MLIDDRMIGANADFLVDCLFSPCLRSPIQLLCCDSAFHHEPKAVSHTQLIQTMVDKSCWFVGNLPARHSVSSHASEPRLICSGSADVHFISCSSHFVRWLLYPRAVHRCQRSVISSEAAAGNGEPFALAIGCLSW